MNWGTWDEMRAVSDAERRSFAQLGSAPMRTADALAMLAPAGGRADVPRRWWPRSTGAALVALYEAKRSRPFLSGCGRARAALRPPRPGPAQPISRLASKAAPAEARHDLLVAYVRGEVAVVLGLSESRIDPEQGLFDMGMDSLMSVDFKGRIEVAVGHRLPSTLTFNYPTDRRAGRLPGRRDAGRPAAVRGADGSRRRLPPRGAPGSRDDLSEDDLAALLAEKLGRVR